MVEKRRRVSLVSTIRMDVNNGCPVSVVGCGSALPSLSLAMTPNRVARTRYAHHPHAYSISLLCSAAHVTLLLVLCGARHLNVCIGRAVRPRFMEEFPCLVLSYAKITVSIEVCIIAHLLNPWTFVRGS